MALLYFREFNLSLNGILIIFYEFEINIVRLHIYQPLITEEHHWNWWYWPLLSNRRLPSGPLGGRSDEPAGLVWALRQGSGQAPRVGSPSYGLRPPPLMRPGGASMVLGPFAPHKDCALRDASTDSCALRNAPRESGAFQDAISKSSAVGPNPGIYRESI